MPDTDDLELQRILTHAATDAATQLQRRGIEARAEGSTFIAKVGTGTWVVQMDAVRAEPGHRERVLDTYAAMVVQSLAKRLGSVMNRNPDQR